MALSENLLQKITIAFCDMLESAGYWVGIYSYKAFLEVNFTPEILNRYAVWVAHTGISQTNFKYPYGVWQYSHIGKINGINTNVDLNYSYTDYPKLIKTVGLNGFSPNTSMPLITHTVVKNDSLWKIADKYLNNGNRYPELKALNNLKSDIIHPGQILIIPLYSALIAYSFIFASFAAWSDARHIHSYKNRLDTNIASQIDAQHIFRQTLARHKCIQNNFLF